jgi:hypothetical protein
MNGKFNYTIAYIHNVPEGSRASGKWALKQETHKKRLKIKK